MTLASQTNVKNPTCNLKKNMNHLKKNKVFFYLFNILVKENIFKKDLLPCVLVAFF